MTQSPEYPDLLWMPPKAWGSGRDGKAVRYIVIHYTAGSERSTSAEDGAAFDQRREDGTSTHYFVDQNSIVQCVRTQDRANAARHRGNRLGIQYELCGTVQTRAQWLDAASLATLKLAARQVARDCRKYAIPARRLSVAETRRCWTDFPDGPKGIVGHVDCTNAYPEDGGDHTDPGPQFPWDIFLDLVQAELEEDFVAVKDDVLAALGEFFKREQQSNNGGWTSQVGRDAGDQGVPNPITGGKSTAYKLWGDTAAAVKALAEQVGVSSEALAAAIDQVDEQVIAALPGLSVEDQGAIIQGLLGTERAAALGRFLAGV